MPRQNADSEDDGWVLTMVYRSASNTTDLAILDAKCISKGPVALIHLPHHIPHGAVPSMMSLHHSTRCFLQRESPAVFPVLCI